MSTPKKIISISFFIFFFLTHVSYSTHDTQATATIHNKPSINQDSPEKISKKKGRRKQKGSHNKKDEKKALKAMNYQELKKEKERYTSENNSFMQLKCVEKMITQCDTPDDHSDLMLECANLLFDSSKFQKAETLYTEFISLFPGSDSIEYSFFRAIDCSFKQIAQADRDQSKTRSTISMAEKFLERSTLFTTYTQQVKEIVGACQKQLFEHEMGVFEFYLNRGGSSMQSAQKRADFMRTEFVDILPEAEPAILVCEYRIATLKNDTTCMNEKALTLAQKFPEYMQNHELDISPVQKESTTILAQDSKKPSFSGRF